MQARVRLRLTVKRLSVFDTMNSDTLPCRPRHATLLHPTVDVIENGAIEQCAIETGGPGNREKKIRYDHTFVFDTNNGSNLLPQCKETEHPQNQSADGKHNVHDHACIFEGRNFNHSCHTQNQVCQKQREDNHRDRQ